MTLAQIAGNLRLLSSLPFFLVYYTFYTSFDYNNPEGRVTDTTSFLTEYDFIVIGGGSAGAVVANRLTEVSDWNVLLLEAGGDEPISSDVPALAMYLQRTNIDWQYKTEKQDGRACLGFTDQRCLWPRGKVLGGSSVLNYMLYVRGNKRDYDAWYDAGNDGWSFDDVLPYFKKSEDNRNPYIAANTQYHGTGGYLTVQEPAYRTPLVTAFVQGGVEMGYDHNDGNAAQQTGFMIAQTTTRNGARCSTSKAFLRPVRHRPNLHISLNSRVLKINIDSNTKSATGVKFEKNGIIYNVGITKEVILSAGAINSPQLLMLSGVGPSSHLKSMGINVIADLSVGDNLQDHVALGGMVFTFTQPYSIVDSRFVTMSVFLNWTINRSGPLTTAGGVEGLAWVKTKYADATIDFPDIEFHFVAGSPVTDGGASIRYNEGVSDDIWDAYYKPLENADTWQVIPMLLRPLSTGTIRLASADPYAKPVIDPQYFSNVQDLNVLIEGTKIGLALGKTEAFQKLGSKFYDKPFPGCESYTLWTDDYWGCFIRQYSSTIYHYSGTCKMGPSTDPAAVVDNELRVHGIQRLRVIDASIMPNVVSGNTNAPTIMIGERGSDFIKNYWLSKRKQSEGDEIKKSAKKTKKRKKSSTKKATTNSTRRRFVF